MAIKSPISLTTSASSKIYSILEDNCCNEKEWIALRIRIASRGCGGNSYKMELCRYKEKYDDLFYFDTKSGNISIVIDKKSMFSLLGTEIDYVEGEIESGFEFHNKRESGRCGCGESFYLEENKENSEGKDGSEEV